MRRHNPYHQPTAREQLHSIYEALRTRAGWEETKVSVEDVARQYLATQDIVYDRLGPAEQAAICRAVETALSE
jgi:hypothetical protein